MSDNSFKANRNSIRVVHLGTNDEDETMNAFSLYFIFLLFLFFFLLFLHFFLYFIYFFIILSHAAFSLKSFFFFSFFLILAFVDSFWSFLGPSSLSFLTNVWFTEIPVAVHWSVIVCVKGQRLAFTKRPRRFQLTAAVALAMCGWECAYLLHSISLTESIPPSSENPAQGPSPKVSQCRPLPPLLYTNTHSPSLPSADNLFREIMNWYGREVVVHMR